MHNPETHEVVLWGQGEMHLRVATERLTDRFGVAIVHAAADASAIARPSEVGRHSAAGTRSSPAATASSATWCSRSSRCRAAAGFSFEDKITGGVVPRNYIPSVEEGVVDALKHGPLGFPVVDVAVTLIDGSYHTRRFLRHGVPHGGPHRRRRGAAAMPAGAAGADPSRRDRLSDRTRRRR